MALDFSFPREGLSLLGASVRPGRSEIARLCDSLHIAMYFTLQSTSRQAQISLAPSRGRLFCFKP